MPIKSNLAKDEDEQQQLIFNTNLSPYIDSGVGCEQYCYIYSYLLCTSSRQNDSPWPPPIHTVHVCRRVANPSSCAV
jgi:hypothetical protein